MERISGINYKRIIWCCQDAKIDLAQLSLEVSVSLNSLEKAIEGVSDLTFNQLSKIAEYFGRGILFFLDPEPIYSEHVHTPAFRTLTNQKPGLAPKLRILIERAEKQRDIFLNLKEDLEHAHTSFAPPKLPKDINEAAEITREWLGLSNECSFDGYRAAIERKGILAFRSNGYNGKWQVPKESEILGFSIYDKKCPIIFIRKLDVEVRQTFTLMHELGHILLHKKSIIDETEDFWALIGPESEANAFAGKVLVPNYFLDLIRDSDKPEEASEFDTWLLKQRKAWGVSTEVILRRLLDSDRLSRNEYRSYRAWRENLPPLESTVAPRMYRHREPKNIFGDTYVRVILDSLSAKNISLSKASTYLDGLKINDLHKLESHYASI